MGRIVKNTVIGLAAVGVLAAGFYAMLEFRDHLHDDENSARAFDPWH